MPHLAKNVFLISAPSTWKYALDKFVLRAWFIHSFLESSKWEVSTTIWPFLDSYASEPIDKEGINCASQGDFFSNYQEDIGLLFWNGELLE